MDEVFQIADAVTVMRDGQTVGTFPIADVRREDILRLMVGRPLDETFPKIVTPPGETLWKSKI